MFIPGIILVIATFFASIFFTLNSGEKKISLKVFIIYTVATLLLFALLGLLDLMPIENTSLFFTGTMTGMLVLGTAHVFGINYLSKDDGKDLFWDKLVFTFYVAAVGGMAYILVFSFNPRFNTLEQLPLRFYFLSSLFAFLVPYFFYKSFEYLIAIPQEEYTKWYFPVDKNLDEELDDEDFEDTKVLLLKFNIIDRVEGDGNVVFTTARAPYRWEFGNYFAQILVLYNDKNAGKQIQYLDQYEQPQGWNFYVQPGRFKGRRYLDPKFTVAENELTGKETIVCIRV